VTDKPHGHPERTAERRAREHPPERRHDREDRPKLERRQDEGSGGHGLERRSKLGPSARGGGGAESSGAGSAPSGLPRGKSPEDILKKTEQELESSRRRQNQELQEKLRGMARSGR
jgi:hypothetical protein